MSTGVVGRGGRATVTSSPAVAEVLHEVAADEPQPSGDHGAHPGDPRVAAGGVPPASRRAASTAAGRGRRSGAEVGSATDAAAGPSRSVPTADHDAAEGAAPRRGGASRSPPWR